LSNWFWKFDGNHLHWSLPVYSVWVQKEFVVMRWKTVMIVYIIFTINLVHFKNVLGEMEKYICLLTFLRLIIITEDFNSKSIFWNSRMNIRNQTLKDKQLLAYSALILLIRLGNITYYMWWQREFIFDLT